MFNIMLKLLDVFFYLDLIYDCYNDLCILICICFMIVSEIKKKQKQKTTTTTVSNLYRRYKQADSVKVRPRSGHPPVEDRLECGMVHQ